MDDANDAGWLKDDPVLVAKPGADDFEIAAGLDPRTTAHEATCPDPFGELRSATNGL